MKKSFIHACAVRYFPSSPPARPFTTPRQTVRTSMPARVGRRTGQVSLKFLICIIFAMACAGTIIGDRLVQPERILPPAENRPAQAPNSPPSWVGFGSAAFDASAMFDTLRLTGNRAPEFALPDVRSDGLRSLKSYRGKPVLLIFGSYDCPVFCAEAQRIEQLYQKYKDRLEFLYVQIAASGHVSRPLESAAGSPEPLAEN